MQLYHQQDLVPWIKAAGPDLFECASEPWQDRLRIAILISKVLVLRQGIVQNARTAPVNHACLSRDFDHSQSDDTRLNFHAAFRQIHAEFQAEGLTKAYLLHAALKLVFEPTLRLQTMVKVIAQTDI